MAVQCIYDVINEGTDMQGKRKRARVSGGGGELEEKGQNFICKVLPVLSCSSSGTRSPSIEFAGCIRCYIRRTQTSNP